MNLKLLFLPFLAILIGIFPLFNAYSAELSLEDAVTFALENSLSLKKTEIDLAASGYSVRNLWSELFPSINASASARFTNSLFSNINPQGAGPGFGLGLNINLGLNAGIPYAMKSIKLLHQGNVLDYEDAKNQLSIRITKMFYSLVAEKNNLSLFDEVFNLAQRQFTRSETMFRNGLVGELSLTQSRLALENARYNLGMAKISYENNMADFLAMLGMPLQDITLSGEVTIVRIEADSNALIENYLPIRPDIVSIKHQIEKLTVSNMQSILESRAPSLSLSMDWSANNFDPYSDSISATARLSIPIDVWIPGTKRSQSLSKSRDSIEKAKLDLESAENSAKTQIRSLTALLRNSWESIIIAKMSLEAAQRNYQLTEQGFSNGAIEALTLEDARNNMMNARQRLLQSELQYFNMILDLSSAININWKNLIQIYGVPSE